MRSRALGGAVGKRAVTGGAMLEQLATVHLIRLGRHGVEVFLPRWRSRERHHREQQCCKDEILQ